MALRPTEFNRVVLTLDKAGLTQAAPERFHKWYERSGRRAVEKSNHRHRRLLRPRRERPRRCRTAEKRDELAPFHSITSSARGHSGRPPNINTTPAQLEAPWPTPPRYLV